MTVNSRIRLVRFSLVGAMGIGVQLSVLALLIALKMDYLLATALAVEAAVLHNFLWHQRFTWPDRASHGLQEALTQLLRFHLSNGVISILGNLALMRLLAGWLRLPVLLANLLTISLCFAANYLASDRWVFLADDSYQGTTSVVPQDSVESLGAETGPALQLRPLAHKQQGPLREGKIDQGRSGSDGQTQSNLRSQQERRQRPQLIEHKDPRKQAQKFSAEAGNVEPDRRKQIQADRNANRRRRDQDSRNPRWVPKDVLQHFFHHTQPRQRDDIKAEIHDLNKKKQHAHMAVWNDRQIFGRSQQGTDGGLGSNRARRICG